MLRSILISVVCFLGSTLGAQQAYTSVGESSMEPLMLLWLDVYRQQVPTFKLDVQAPGTSQGVQGILEGKTDIAPSSRPWTSDEINAFTAKHGNPPGKVTVALDALAIIVHQSNPIKELKLEQLDAIWSSTRLQRWDKDIVTWGDAGVKESAWATRPITLYGRTGGSGIRDHFVEFIMLGGKSKPNVRRGPDMGFLLEAIISDQTGTGYGSLGELSNGVKAVPIVPIGGKAGIEPTHKTVADGSYPLVHPLYIYYNKAKLDPAVKKFLLFILSSLGQKQVLINGTIPLPDNLVQLNQKSLLR